MKNCSIYTYHIMSLVSVSGLEQGQGGSLCESEGSGWFCVRQRNAIGGFWLVQLVRKIIPGRGPESMISTSTSDDELGRIFQVKETI